MESENLNIKHLTMYLSEIVNLTKNDYLRKRLTNNSLATTKCTRNGTSTSKHWGKKCIQNPLQKKITNKKSQPLFFNSQKDVTYIAQQRNWKKEVQIQHPSTTTKPLKPSLITCPVRSGVSAASLAATGLGERTGHAFTVPTTTQSLTNQIRKEVYTKS